MYYIKRFSVLFLLIISTLAATPAQAYAGTPADSCTARVLFVVDISGSMASNDPERLVPDLVKIFAAMNTAKNI